MKVVCCNRWVGLCRWMVAVVCGVAALIGAPRASVAADSPSAAAILQDLKSFQQMASVLMIAAHPDDENTQLITYLARGRGYRMAYLSVTRGDGGQNVLGGEFGDELGWIRTQELLAARRLDGGRQFFTRAMDFGFSKNPTETLQIWDRQQVLGDVVRVIRTFRPDVVVTRFAPTQTNTHGHHTASAILGLEAFKVAGDPKSFPEQLTTLAVWQPRRIVVNGFGGPAGGAAPGPTYRMDVGGDDPVLHQSFGAIASQSRAMHKTQGFGNFAGGPGGPGGRGGAGGARVESFVSLAPDVPPAPASTGTPDLMDGIDTTWARVGVGGNEIAQSVNDAIAKFNADDLTANVPALLQIKKRVAALPDDPIVREKQGQLDRIIQACLGLSVETTVPNAEVVPGEALALHVTVREKAGMPIRWVSTHFPSIKGEIKADAELKADTAAERDITLTLPANTPVSQPYWLRAEGTVGMFRVDDASLIGRPENPPSVPVEHVFEMAGQTLTIPDEPVQLVAGAPPAQARRRLDVIAAVALQFPFDVRLFVGGAARPIDVNVTAYRANAAGTLQLDMPAGWKAAPESQSFKLAAVGDHAKLSFTVTPPAFSPSQPATATLTAHADIGGERFTTARKEIRYDHIPILLMQPPARLRVVSLDLATRGKTIGYIPGAGDSVAECLEEMGYAVTPLKGADLTPENLKKFDAVVIGVRAFNTRDDLNPNLKNLFAYVEAGGTVVEQYNRPDGLRSGPMAPYNLRLSASRVTDENAAVTFLAPDHPVLNTPNKITAADFDGWIQERGIYYPNQWDDKFTPILAASDPGEAPLNGALLVAQHGKGYFVYTGLVFFRELPAGVPGAYRLFANMVSLGKP